MRYAIYIPLNTEDLTLELTMVAYEKRQNAIKFARANNSDLLRALKHLMETRLKKLTKVLWFGRVKAQHGVSKAACY